MSEEAAQAIEVSAENVDQVVQDIAQTNAQRNPEDIAAEFFQQNYRKYKGLLSVLSKKDLMRVNDALIAYPLEMEKLKFNDKRAHLAFALGFRLLEAKQIMMNFVQLEQLKALNEQSGEVENTASPVTNNEPLNNEQGENNNG